MCDEASVGAILLDALNLLGLGVAPAHLLTLRVEVEAVGYAEVVVHDHASMRAVHVGALNLGRLAIPVRPEDVAVDGVQSDAARICQMRFDQHFAVLAVQ